MNEPSNEEADALPDSGQSQEPQAPSAPSSPFPKGPGALSPLFEGVDKFDQALPENARTALAPVLANAMDPKGQRQRLANQMLLSQRYNLPPQEIAENYELYRDDYAKKAFGVENPTDESFYTQAGTQLKKEKTEADMLGQMYGPMYQAFSGEKPMTQAAFMKSYLPTLAQNPAYDPAHLDLYYQHALDQWNAFENFSSGHHQAVDAVRNYLALASTQLAGDTKVLPDQSKLGPARDDAISALASLSPSDQALVVSLGQRGIHTKEEEGIQKFAGRFSRGAEHLVKGAWALTGDILDQMPGVVTNPELNAGKQRADRLLTSAFENGVDPMQAQGMLGKAILNTSENLPALAASFSGPGLALNLAATTHQLQGHYEDQGISSGKALALASIGAAGQTATQFVSAHLIEGNIPGLSNWISSLPSKLARLGVVAGSEAATLGTMNAVQAKLPDWTQQLAGSFDDTLPKIAKDSFWDHVTDPVAALELLPLVLVGAGAGAFRHGVFGENFLTPERIKAAGYPEDIAGKIASAPSIEAKEHLLEQNAPKREFGTIAQKTAMAQVEAAHSQQGVTADISGIQSTDTMAKAAEGDSSLVGSLGSGEAAGAPGSDVWSRFLEKTAQKLSMESAGQHILSEAHEAGVTSDHAVDQFFKDGWNNMPLAEKIKLGDWLASNLGLDTSRTLTPETLKEYFKPGRVLRGGYSEGDTVLAYQPKEDGSLGYVEVKGEDGRVRRHATLPDYNKVVRALGQEVVNRTQGEQSKPWRAENFDWADLLKHSLGANDLTELQGSDRGVVAMLLDAQRKYGGERKGAEGVAPLGAEASTRAMRVEKTLDGTFLIKGPDGQVEAHVATPEMAAKAAHDVASRSPSEQMELSDLEDGKPEGPAPANVEPMDLSDLEDGKKTSLAAALKSQPLGIVDQVSHTVHGWIASALQTVRGVAKFARDVPKLEGFKRIINRWQGNQELAVLRMKPFLAEVMRIAPSRVTREGIANYIDAGGDMAQLQAGLEGTSKASVKRGYEAAMKLTPAQQELAMRIKSWFDAQFERAKAAGIMDDEDFRHNYVTQMIDRPFVGGGVKSEFYGKLSKNFQYSEARTFPNFGELEKAGFDVSTKDIGEIMAKYEASLTRAIETRRMVDSLMAGKDADGYPLAYRGKAPEGVDIDYEQIDHPSLKGVKFNPEIASHLKNLLGRSAISDWYEQPGSPALQAGKAILKGLDQTDRFVAHSMLSGLSPFHMVHEAKRAAGSGVNVFNMEPLDPSDPRVERALSTGLSLVHPGSAASEFTDSLGGHGKTVADYIPGVAQVNRAIGHLTFDVVIPRLKFTTWVKYEARNLEHFSKEIEAGKMTKDDVAYLTSQQVNARFGHLNAADLGKNPTIRHIAKMVTLAPDFWESNVRNYGQVLSGLTLSKAGAEPLKAFLLTGGVTWVIARALNSALNEDHNPHFEEPFGVVHNGRTYTMRSETEDLVRMIRGFRQSFQGGGRNTYLSGRFSPLFGSMIDMLSGSNWRGEKQSTVDALRDYLAKVVPLSLRAVPGVREGVEALSGTERNRTITMLQEMLGNFGIQVARKSDINEAYKLAGDWKKSQGIKEDTGVYPTSKYQGLRYALEDADMDRAQKELSKLAPKTPKEFKEIEKGVHSSLLHPWTGSKASDAEFVNSLGQKDQHKVIAAEWHRESMFINFQRELEDYAKTHGVAYHPSMTALHPTWFVGVGSSPNRP